MLAAHLLGSASVSDEQELDLHLRECAQCRLELESLKPLLPLYRKARLASGADFDPADWEQRLRRRLTDHLRRRRRRRFGLRVGAVLTLGAVAAAALLLPPLVQPTPTSTFRAVGNTTHASGTVAYQAKPWGTQLVLQVAGLPGGQALVAYVEPVRGPWLEAGSWRASGRGREVVEVAAMLPIGRIKGVVVETPAGQRLLAAPGLAA